MNSASAKDRKVKAEGLVRSGCVMAARSPATFDWVAGRSMNDRRPINDNGDAITCVEKPAGHHARVALNRLHKV